MHATTHDTAASLVLASTQQLIQLCGRQEISNTKHLLDAAYTLLLSAEAPVFVFAFYAQLISDLAYALIHEPKSFKGSSVACPVLKNAI